MTYQPTAASSATPKIEKNTIRVISTALRLPAPPVSAPALPPFRTEAGDLVGLVGISVGNPILALSRVGNREAVGYLVSVGVLVYGAVVGTTVGVTVGLVGIRVDGFAEEGLAVGVSEDGLVVGVRVGSEVGSPVGLLVGTLVGFTVEGLEVGVTVGTEGLAVEEVGVLVGRKVGITEGVFEGFTVGLTVGSLEGFCVGSTVGSFEGF